MIDEAGNISAQSEELVVTIDRGIPAVPSDPDLLASSDSGASDTDNLTSVQQPAFSGTGEPNAAVRVYANGLLVGQSVVTTSGDWEVTVEPLVDGNYDITAEQEDLAGNISPLSGALAITIDASSPQRPTLNLENVDDTGASDLDNVTNVANPVPFTVTSEAGTQVVIKDGNTVIDGPFTSLGTNTRAPTLADGEYLLSVESTDDAGNVSVQSVELVVNIDRAAPAASDANFVPSSDTGVIGDGFTNIQQPAFTGLAEANAHIRVFANGVLVGEGTVNSDESDGDATDGLGVWEVTVEPLANGSYDITTEVEDLAGNIGPTGTPLEITIDVSDPQRPTIDLLAVNDTGSSQLDNVTFQANDVPFTVTADGGTDVVIKDGNDIIDTFPTTGTSVVRLLTLSEGTHLLSVETIDIAGNVSAQSEELVVTIDRTAPDASTPELAATSDTGVVGDDTTSLQQPAIVGIAEANARIHVFADGVLVGTGFVQSDETDGVSGDGLGIWEITVEPLADGDYDITTIVEDLAGNSESRRRPTDDHRR